MSAERDGHWPEDNYEADADCIRRIRQGDPESYAPLVQLYLPRLRALMWRFFKNADDADEYSQAALVRAYEQLDRYDAIRPFYPWLRRIAVNLALHELEKRKRNADGLSAESALEGLKYILSPPTVSTPAALFYDAGEY